ncbi:MAG TPA: hypothetical protein G4N92_06165 [Anaerolineae bacterium]|nr:hypothetical protein [Anaerolineae bacterium]
MAISLLDGSIHIDIFFEPRDSGFEDNICVCIKETCPEEEKILYAGETNIFLEPDQARQLAEMLLKAAEHSSHGTR